jgi:hypothetical protein
MIRHADRRRATSYGRELVVIVDRGAMLQSTVPGIEIVPAFVIPLKPGAPELCWIAPGGWTIRGGVWRLLTVSLVTFLLFTPSAVWNRKGKNNAETALPEEVGSPWAIGDQGRRSARPSIRG